MVGSQFEQMVGLMTQCLYKTVGKADLSWQDLEELLLETEITLNNRPLNYLEDDIQFPVLTPNTLAFGDETFNLEEDINMLGRICGKKRSMSRSVRITHEADGKQKDEKDAT